jgi:hypothetical protein
MGRRRHDVQERPHVLGQMWASGCRVYEG